jgi:hypothetical protein
VSRFRLSSDLAGRGQAAESTPLMQLFLGRLCAEMEGELRSACEPISGMDRHVTLQNGDAGLREAAAGEEESGGDTTNAIA